MELTEGRRLLLEFPGCNFSGRFTGGQEGEGAGPKRAS